jgi:aminomethyltransferase
MDAGSAEQKRTPLYDTHVEIGARFVDFAGWRMPLAYGSQIAEHRAVRSGAGVFDVSHMTIVDLQGPGAGELLGRLLANDARKLDVPGKALYSCLLREDGGILDDLIAYRLERDCYRLVANAATRAKDLAWLVEHSVSYDVEVAEKTELALLAVQGPGAREVVARCLPGGERCLDIRPFHALELGDVFVARTGYTGEDGFEIALGGEVAPSLWHKLTSRGVIACGLGARDTLRLEAGLNLYGADMDERVTPLECGLAWTVPLEDGRRFLGREALEEQLAAGVARKRVGLVLEGRGVLRAGWDVETDCGEGLITSGGYAPTLGRSIALARVPVGARGECSVIIRGRGHSARIVSTPFVRHGEIKVELQKRVE